MWAKYNFLISQLAKLNPQPNMAMEELEFAVANQSIAKQVWLVCLFLILTVYGCDCIYSDVYYIAKSDGA